jgi:DNA mismatch endonuclease (patch repair protein)
MSGIRAKNTKPELTVRKYLHAAGLRFRLHERRLPGTPDIVLPRWRAVVFVHGCFWHWHGCRYSKMPSTRTAFWQEKLLGNKARDEKNAALLEGCGWRVFVVYECQLRDDAVTVLEQLAASIRDV